MIKINCAKCKKPVENISWVDNQVSDTVFVMAKCHGETEFMVIRRADFTANELKQMDNQVGTAFAETNCRNTVTERWFIVLATTSGLCTMDVVAVIVNIFMSVEELRIDKEMEMVKNQGGPAHPQPAFVSQNACTGETTQYQYSSEGMTMRQYYAAHAHLIWQTLIRRSIANQVGMAAHERF